MASIPENEIPFVIEALQALMAANTPPTADALDEEEIKLVREHRRQKQLNALLNRGITISKPREPEPPVRIVENPLLVEDLSGPNPLDVL